MRMRNELTIRGEPSEVAKLVQRIESADSGPWKRDRSIEERLWRPTGTAPSTYCFETPAGPDRLAAYLLLDKNVPGGLEVFNIMPVDRKPPTDEQYNYLLEQFKEEFLMPIADGIGVEVTIHPFRVNLEKNLSRDAIEKLESFRQGVNKAAFSPADRRRWHRFVSQVHIDGSMLDFDELIWTLNEWGFSEEQSRQLIEWYTEGLVMLADYDEARAG